MALEGDGDEKTWKECAWREGGCRHRVEGLFDEERSSV